MDKNNKRLLIHRNMEPVSLEHSVEIILTPQFYTFIREDLDIKFSYQAKQIAASLFDDYLDTSKEYQYHVNKCHNHWCFYAYNIEEIETFLESIGIQKHRVSKIYFAQELNSKLEEPVQLCEKNVLQSIDDIVTIIPTRLLEENITLKPLNLKDVKLNSSISMGASLTSFISLKESIILSTLFFILGAIFMVEGNRIKSSIVNENEQLIQLLDDNPTYGTTLVRNSILEKYQPIDSNERAKRESLKEISKLLSANSQLSKLKIEKDSIKTTIKTSNPKISRQVMQSAKAKKFKGTNSGSTVTVEKKL